MFDDGMHLVGFVPSKVDPDVWIRPTTKSNGEQYYEYLLVYIDNIMSIIEEPEITINKLKRRFSIREETVESPKKYLGADIKEWQLPDGRLCCQCLQSSMIRML